MGEISPASSDIGKNTTVPLEKPLTLEEAAIQKLLQGEEVEVWHQLTSPDDFDTIQQHGMQGNYKLTVGEKPYYLSYYVLGKPKALNEKHVVLKLNRKDDKPFRVFDGRNWKPANGREAQMDLISQGYDGLIEGAGVGVPMDQKFQLKVFDGASLAGRFQRAQSAVSAPLQAAQVSG